MIYANPVPVANACQMGKDVVEDALKAICKAIIDLTMCDRDISLQMGFCNVRITDRKLKVIFADYLAKELSDKNFEGQMKRQASPVATLWKTSYNKNFERSSLGTLIKKPNQEVTEALNEKTKALKMMSLDMSSSSKFTKSAAPRK
mmetsp:Transcript_39463/g.28537  ORF Transcript_39463/g.28537 Transcript_39463/m.28537 type:complete len:146 (-) Transcript_39463:147-584(-)|eukprot:CAMPEP_0116877922 /NCGR_PEP_ID=MMETSP0463-20121206/9678_1 /TAXON_ID=181622 /ORGANISM="Strombidinopsis sp, Strain SopsisLIS2011" /LENGTH=145 /DNA_ID=CAMNT_0004525639 /DNA_START=453 /DNA_END=890 /DNA_ORIENTATION=+